MKLILMAIALCSFTGGDIPKCNNASRGLVVANAVCAGIWTPLF